MLNLKNKLNGPAGPILLSAISGILLILFWIFINQIRVTPQTSQTQVAEAIIPPPDMTVLTPKETQQQPNTSQSASTTLPAESTPKIKRPAVTPPIVPQNPPGPYKDGTYRAISQTPWGDYSISIEVKNGNWIKVNAITIPDSPPSQYASSILAQQALQAQSAAIDGVSGATYVSQAFADDLSQIVQQSKI